MNDQPRGIGDNLGSVPSGEILREFLADSNARLIKRRDELLETAGRIPAEFKNEDEAQRAGDYIKQVAAASKAAEAARVDSKEPYLEAGRAVDGFYKAISEPLDRVKRDIEKRLTLFLREKAEAERRERMERERLAREEAERIRREAEEAEKRIADEKSLREAIAADKLADHAEADVVQAQKDADARPADLARTRSEYGAVSTLRTYWTFSHLSRPELDLEALRAHLPLDGLERAIRSYIKAGGRELRGVEIFETSDAYVR